MKHYTRILLLLLCGLLTLSGIAQGLTGTTHPAGDRPARQQGQHGQYTLEQAMSDRAQLTTIAFSGLAFITGDFGASTFIPPGKVCDFFGFQYMRDVDVAGQGHNPKFLNRVAGNVFTCLNDGQKGQFQTLAAEQAPQFRALAVRRYPLIKAFCRQLNGEIPAGSAGLNKAAVVKYVGDIFARDAEMSYRRAEVMAKVYLSLTPEQKAYFAKMKFGDFNSWPAVDEQNALHNNGGNRDPLYNVAYMTYASEYFSWTAGSIEADTYFCPERHGTYFGGFYMKDMPAMGKRDYNISTSRTGDSGEAFVMQVCDATQRQIMTGILEQQRAALKEAAAIRRSISTELRKFLQGQTPDKAKVIALGRRYGELDGEMSWYYTTAFAKVKKTLTMEQRTALMKLRNLDGYVSAPAYLYSQTLQTLPTLPNTDVFFAEPKNGALLDLKFAEANVQSTTAPAPTVNAGQTNDNAVQEPPDGKPKLAGSVIHVLPREIAGKLNLTDQQRAKIAALETDISAKLAQILTTEQLTMLQQFRPPRHEDGPGQGADNKDDRRPGPDGG